MELVYPVLQESQVRRDEPRRDEKPASSKTSFRSLGHQREQQDREKTQLVRNAPGGMYSQTFVKVLFMHINSWTIGSSEVEKNRVRVTLKMQKPSKCRPSYVIVIVIN